MKTTLYIATHNKTGLKYFGKSSKYFTEQDLQENYHGSGKRWLNHLNKHGDDVTMEIYGIFEKAELKEKALSFSEINNIVTSNLWANLMSENGTDGGDNARNIDYKNPERQRKLVEATKNSWDKKLGKHMDFEVVCHKCGKETSTNERAKQFPKKEKYFCSRSCANSKTPTKEANERRGKSVSNYYKKLSRS